MCNRGQGRKGGVAVGRPRGPKIADRQSPIADSQQAKNGEGTEMANPRAIANWQSAMADGEIS